jgi:hypothetical protein
MNKTVDREVPKIETVNLTRDYQFLDGIWLLIKVIVVVFSTAHYCNVFSRYL